MELFRTPLMVLDTETTGLPRDSWAEVVELGCVLLGKDGAEVASWQTLIRPEVLDERCDGALKVNQIARTELEAADPVGVVLPRFAAWLDGEGFGARSPWTTAFNIGFDRQMLERSGFVLPWANCIMLRAQELMGPAGALQPAPERIATRGQRWKWPSLAEAARFFDVNQAAMGDAHRALTDARVAAHIAVAIQRRSLEGSCGP